MKDELRMIPKKNYVILGIILVVSFFLLYYFQMWLDLYKETKLNVKILDKYMEVINYNELDNYLVEDQNAVIYVSILENEDIRKFEKRLKKLYKKHAINTEILYMDITEEITDQGINGELKDKYAIDESKLPIVLVFENGTLKDTYSISDNEYSIDNFKIFVDNLNNRFEETDG